MDDDFQPRRKKKNFKRRRTKEPEAPPTDVQDVEVLPPAGVLVDDVVSWIAHDAELDEAQQDRVRRALTSNKTKLEVFMTVVAAARAQRLQKLLRFTERIEDRLFSDETLENADTYELIQISRVSQSSLRDHQDFLNGVLKGAETETLHRMLQFLSRTDTASSESANLSASDRAGLRTLVTRLEKAVERADNGQSRKKRTKKRKKSK